MPLLRVEGLKTIGGKAIEVDEEARALAAAAEVAGVKLEVGEDSVEGAVGDAAADVRKRRKVTREKVDGATEGCRSNGRSRARTAVEIYTTDPWCGKEGSGVVSGGVRIFEGDAIEVDVVVAIGETAKVGLSLAKPDPVGVDGEGAGGHLDEFVEVGDR